MTDSLERFLQDLRFDVPDGLVDRAKAAAGDAAKTPRQPRELGRVSRRVDRTIPMDRRTELAAGIAAVVIAAIIVGTFAYIRGGANPHTAAHIATATPDSAIEQYQVMVGRDEQRIVNFLMAQCNPPEASVCATQAAVVIAELHGWLTDLNQSLPPSRFAPVAGQMRRHLTLAISDLGALITANTMQNETAMTTALAASISERDTLQREAAAVINSSPGTITTYTAIVRLDKSNLLACSFCQRLVSHDQMSCQASSTPTCVDEIAATRLQVETFQDDLVRTFAPDSLAAEDGLLQADLMAAAAALDAMSSALSAADQAALGASQNALRRALSQADADAMNIAPGA